MGSARCPEFKTAGGRQQVEGTEVLPGADLVLGEAPDAEGILTRARLSHQVPMLEGRHVRGTARGRHPPETLPHHLPSN